MKIAVKKGPFSFFPRISPPIVRNTLILKQRFKDLPLRQKLKKTGPPMTKPPPAVIERALEDSQVRPESNFSSGGILSLTTAGGQIGVSS